MAGSFDGRDEIARLLAGLPPKPTRLSDLAKPTNSLLAALSPSPLDLGPARPFTAPTNSLASLFAAPTPYSPIPPAQTIFPRPTALPVAGVAAPFAPRALPVAPAVKKRKGFFSFHFNDIMRVNNVRNAWSIKHPDRELKRNFYDRSLWENTKRTNPEALKNLIRRGMEHSSTVCVMVGSQTYLRPWVRYEIARAVVDNRGLLAVHINSLNHITRRCSDPPGCNPLDYMGVYQTETGAFRLCELNEVWNAQGGHYVWQWQPFELHRANVALPKYLAKPAVNQAVRLSSGTHAYDYVRDLGSNCLGDWIDHAAKQVGR